MKQGQYLKEIGISFLLEEKLDPKKVILKMERLIKYIGMIKNSFTVNLLPPGFDLIFGLKESCLYFGYWEEEDYARIFISTCKNYNEKKLVTFIKNNFKLNSPIKLTIINDTSIVNEVCELCLMKY